MFKISLYLLKNNIFKNVFIIVQKLIVYFSCVYFYFHLMVLFKKAEKLSQLDCFSNKTYFQCVFLDKPYKISFTSSLFINGNENVYFIHYYFCIIFIQFLFLFMHLIPVHLLGFHNFIIPLTILVSTHSGCLMSTIQHFIFIETTNTVIILSIYHCYIIASTVTTTRDLHFGTS